LTARRRLCLSPVTDLGSAVEMVQEVQDGVLNRFRNVIRTQFLEA
jgi:hypothetical protein